MRSLLPISEDEVLEFRVLTSAGNPGIGIVDLLSGRIYLVVASKLSDGDHASLIAQALGIDDVDSAAHVRGFVVGWDRGRLRFVNNSGLNPYNNRMESEIFESVKTILTRQLM